jgi:hypothetical protein
MLFAAVIVTATGMTFSLPSLACHGDQFRVVVFAQPNGWWKTFAPVRAVQSGCGAAGFYLSA